jgi:predicted MPP superfamily phosphohydrolase
MTAAMLRPIRVLAVAVILTLTSAWPVPATAIAGAWQARAPAQPPAQPAEKIVSLPNQKGSLKFAVLGDFGTGERDQYQTAERMALVLKQFPFELVLLVGDNLYGSERPQDFRQKFEIPYKPLLDAKVKFYASLGNHDSHAEQTRYEHFNMNGEPYYTFKAPVQNVRFFVLDSSYPEPKQITWLEKELKSSNDDWKIAFFHHPPYSSGGRHGSDLRLRQTLEPLFVQYNVSVVFTGHDHFYERIKPQKDIVYFVTGSGGKLSPGDIRAGSPLTAKGFDTDCVFLVAEIVGDEMVFNAIARSGRVVDSGLIARRKPGPRPVAAPPAPPPSRP